jgi:regulator of protease activity HflC (stomatin/prohibitin superfamily)
VSIILIVVSFQTLDPNEVAFDLDNNIGQIASGGKLFDGGRYFLGLGHSFIKYPRTVQNLPQTSVLVRSSDGLPITMDISVQYTLPYNSSDRMRIVYNFFENSYESAMAELIDGLVRDVAANYTAYQFFENRTLLSTNLNRHLDTFFTDLYINIANFQLINILFPTAFNQEIDNTAIAVQEAIRATSERQVSLVQLQTRNGTIQADISIANLQRDTTVANIINNANNTANSLIDVFSTEAESLAAVKSTLALTNDELLAYIFVKMLQNTNANVRLAIGINPKLV